MSDTQSHGQWTFDRYVLLPEDGRRHEILGGEHVVTPSPSTRHQRLSGRLFAALSAYVNRCGLGEVFHAPYDVVLSHTDVVQPDLIFVSNHQAAKVTADNLQGAPDLVVEILSTSTRKRDEVLKRDLYEHFGVLEYWVVDPEAETVKVYHSSEVQFEPPIVFGRGENLIAVEIDGLRIGLDGLFQGSRPER